MERDDLEVRIRARIDWAFVYVAAGRPRRIPAAVRDDFLRASEETH